MNFLTHRTKRIAYGAGLALFGLLNLSAFMHAWRMTRFVAAGARTAAPESLSRLRKAVVLMTGVRIPKPVNDRDPAAFGLEFRAVEIPCPGGPTLAGWHLDLTSAPGTIVMCHGYATSKSSLLAESAVFQALGWRVLLLDFRGCGDSPGRTTTLGAAESADVVAALAWVRARAPQERVVLFGASMGAAAVLRALAATEDIEPPAGIILERPFDRLLTTVRHRFSAMGLPSFPAAHLLVFWGGLQCGFNGFAHNPAEYARQVTCPALVLHGGRDPRVSVSEAGSVARNLGGRSEVHVFEEIAHRSYCDVAPDRYRAVLAAWLAERAR